MISVLVVDDDSRKAEAVSTLIRNLPDVRAEDVDVAGDLVGARDLLHSKYYDLLILDLRLPNRRGDEPGAMAGAEFVRELSASTTVIKPHHIIGLTAYPELVTSSDPMFRREMWYVIQYVSGTSDWWEQLKGKIEYLCNSKRSLLVPGGAAYDYDLAIVTALPSPELQAVRDLSGDWIEASAPTDPAVFYTTTLRRSGKSLRVVAAAAPQMGMPAAAALASKTILRWRPRFIAMTGIVAAFRDSAVEIGDLLVADATWDYGSGKLLMTKDGEVFQPDPRQLSLAAATKERMLALKADRSYIDEIYKGWRGSKPKAPPNVHVGPVASGAAVIASSTVRDLLRRQSRKVLGLDMEMYGVFYAAENTCKPSPVAIAIKGVTDYADPKKGDEFQEYCAYISAQYIYHFALEYIA